MAASVLRLHGPERDPEPFGDHDLREPLEVRHLQHLPLLRGEGPEGLPDLLTPDAQRGLVHDPLR